MFGIVFLPLCVTGIPFFNFALDKAGTGFDLYMYMRKVKLRFFFSFKFELQDSQVW